MNNKFLAVLAACLSFIILQCTEPKPEPSSPTVVLSNPEYGGFDSQVQWGEHLVTIAGCNDCHTPKKMGPMGPELDTSLRLSGHPSMMPKIEVDKWAMLQKGLTVTQDLTEWVGPWGTSYAANLTPDPTGTGDWTIDNFTMALREGKYKGMASSRSLLPPMPWEMFKHMSDYEIKAIFAYLKTIKPIANTVPAPLPPPSEPIMPSKSTSKKK
ncbi:MAG: c-type cytochrome [Saprospiraceae bacterium]|nr:c-type cytochrome [Saprospiraceae bacterium]